MIGKTLSHFHVLEKLGSGGMGEVYLARDTDLDRQVALKFLPTDVAADRERLRRFVQEARAASAINHANVAHIYEIREADGVYFIAMEYVEGQTLESKIGSSPLQTGEILNMGIQIADALDAAHTKGITHRDLKPANIMVTPRGQVKVLDFGLAMIAAPQPAASEAPTVASMNSGVVGTLGYMSPEQARGEEVDARTDIFSFGAVLYKMATGQMAFSGQTPALIYDAILNSTPASPARLNPQISKLFDEIIQKATAKDRSQRHASAAVLRSLLEMVKSVGISPSTREQSIAVLPFSDMSPQRDQEYFCDGLAEELINTLARLPRLNVASRTSAFRFRGRDLDIREIGRQLNVKTMLEGSIRRSGNRLRITVQLINVDDGYHLLSERYDREMKDVFAIQDEITESILKALEPALLGERQPLIRRHTENLEAFELYLKGLHFWQHRTGRLLRLGLEHFRKAMGVDPDYALAHAGVAYSLAILRGYGYVSAPESRSEAERAARKAMDLDPGLAESHFAAALFTLAFVENWPSAESHFKRALEINPRFSLVQAYYQFFLAATRRFEEAFALAKECVNLDPLSPFVHAMVALTFYLSRRYDRALRACERSLELQPDFPLALLALGQLRNKLRRYGEAIETFERLVLLTNRAPVFIGNLGMALALANRKAEAEALFDELCERTSTEYISPLGGLYIQIGLGDRDGMHRQLQAYIDDGSSGFPIANQLAPYLDDLVSEPRFAELFRRLHIPPRMKNENDS